MDLLAGLMPQAETGQRPGISETAESIEPGFAVILAQVVNSVNGLIPPEPDSLTSVVESSIAGEEILQGPILDARSGEIDNADNAVLPASPESQSTVNIIETVDFLNQGNSQLPALLESKIPVSNEPADIFNQSQSDLPVDTFKSPFKELNLVNSVRPEVKVQSSSVPAPVITVNSKSVTRVVNHSEPPTALLANDVLARLNLKEIHIKTEKRANVPVEIANKSITNINFAPNAEIEKSDATATQKAPDEKAETAAKIIADQSEPETDNGFSKNHAQAPVKLKTEEGDLLSAKVKTSDKFETVIVNEKAAVQTNVEQNLNIDSRIWTQTEPDQSAPDIRPNQPVKVVLPEQTKLSGDNRSHSLIIKIEPEHLGPARLDLHLKNEVLTARLTVETAAAKTTLENSINSLKEQLARADIKVEQIQINVRGETNYDQLFERQPQWQKFSSAHQNRFNARDFLEPIGPVNQINSFIQNQYVGAGGVNVLA